MNETEKLSDLNNYKILIQQKFNRRKKLKTKYLTNDFEFSENENEALEFANFQEAEECLEKILTRKKLIRSPRIFVKYIGDI